MIITFFALLVAIVVGDDVKLNGLFLLAETISYCLIAITIKFIWFGL